ncbi:hypothetical protein BDP55DRAFT_638821 [Colletotrichum godetiae]|uniref:Uncharacterized protein n=1 Tax=Colletotrichum godetiae TaxID=1209918 RepID=A0AAJ0EQ92_9PEZI|nr:uncharacterized protein BDP55DRAFT_638821 [Colletotrichum godetiae]KAK1657364.1 hypothetical protein BDP55DRAFT_638821 [Colletotrichum godetiae]
MASIPKQTSVKTVYETRIAAKTLIKTVTWTVTDTQGDLEVSPHAPYIITTALQSAGSSAPDSYEKLDQRKTAGNRGGTLAIALIVSLIGVWSLHRRRTPFERDDLKTGYVSELTHLPRKFEGAIFMSVGQNVLNRKLIEGLTDAVKDLDSRTIVNTGATALRDVLPVEYNTPAVEQGISGIVILFNEG